VREGGRRSLFGRDGLRAVRLIAFASDTLARKPFGRQRRCFTLSNSVCDTNSSHVISGSLLKAGIAQLVEQLTCNQQVTGSIPVAGSVEHQRLT
jgi:hypothetical protein